MQYVLTLAKHAQSMFLERKSEREREGKRDTNTDREIRREKAREREEGERGSEASPS